MTYHVGDVEEKAKVAVQVYLKTVHNKRASINNLELKKAISELALALESAEAWHKMFVED